jgi:hypothetical protein
MIYGELNSGNHRQNSQKKMAKETAINNMETVLAVGKNSAALGYSDSCHSEWGLPLTK